MQFLEHHKLALKYFSEMFGLPFMFSKCDAIACPEFTIGGMEYPGSITYAEALFSRGTPNISTVSRAGRVAVHECAHMWFGDCVTSYWWNDTWLKESFADYMAYLACHDDASTLSFPIENSMITLLLRKNWGYSEDSKSTTHPIAAEIRSTEEADGVFDGISYAKGAGALKQLVFLVGKENFGKAMKIYFERRAWKNARLQDLIDIYQEVLNGEPESHLDMQKWNRDWLGTAGTNIIEAVWSKDSSKIVFKQGFVLKEYPTLRFHKIKVSLFAEDGSILRS